MKIKTVYCDLCYPSHWKEYIAIRQTDNTVRFLADIKDYETQPLFDIHFDSDTGSPCGMLMTKNGAEVFVSLTVYPIVQAETMSQEQLDLLYGMQEDLNDLLENLALTEPRETTPAAAEQTDQDIEIETPYGKLKYPGMWKTYLQLHVIEEDVYTVGFYAKVGDHPEQHLFDVRLMADADGEFRMYSETGAVCSLDVEFALFEADDSWEQEDADILYGMLEGFNYLIETLNTAKG